MSKSGAAPNDYRRIVLDMNMPDSPLLAHIAEITDEPIEVVVGRLVLLLQWVARHMNADGVVRHATRGMLVRTIGGSSEFWDAMADAGFFVWTDDGLRVGDLNGRRLDQD